MSGSVRNQSPRAVASARRRAQLHPKKDGGMRLLNYAIVILVIIVALLFLQPYLGTELVRVELPRLTSSAVASSEPAGPQAEPGAAATDANGKPKPKKEAKQNRTQIDEFFRDDGRYPSFNFDFVPEEWEYLKKDPRRYAEAQMTDDSGKIFKGVAVKLKGSAGSFQGADGKPGLTVSMNKYKLGERWHGFLKWHLNNGAQDATYLLEQISCEMARKAGVPASRCSHAFVKWHGRDLGLYVFKESFDRDFLTNFFSKPDGDLYDGGFVHDLDVNMEKDLGDPLKRDNIKELIAASQDGNPQARWERLDKVLNIEEFLSFLAIESLTCHWDGYNFNRNNYRLYFDSETGKASFFLHGTDQTFGDSNFPVVRDSGAMVGQAVLSNPEWKKRYRERVDEIYQTIIKPIDWPARVVEIGQRVQTALAEKNPQWAKDYQNRINEARDRVANRIAAIGKQLGDMPKPFTFDKDGAAKLTAEGWHQEGAAAQIDGTVLDGRPCLHIRTDGETSASWRKSITLQPGKFRLEAKVRTAGVVAIQTQSGEGAGLRISGGNRTGQAENSLKGDTPWTAVSYAFDSPGGDVVLVAELRASKGEVWFERDSFRLVEVK